MCVSSSCLTVDIAQLVINIMNIIKQTNGKVKEEFFHTLKVKIYFTKQSWQDNYFSHTSSKKNMFKNYSNNIKLSTIPRMCLMTWRAMMTNNDGNFISHARNFSCCCFYCILLGIVFFVWLDCLPNELSRKRSSQFSF